MEGLSFPGTVPPMMPSCNLVSRNTNGEPETRGTVSRDDITEVMSSKVNTAESDRNHKRDGKKDETYSNGAVFNH
jgi:hypothetical protein